ncbi:MAG: S8 family peptidase [Ichthyobacteriaceae bacterium]|nr:S8 family peptidase [Ichthyobacteriaceae bacterium]
MIEIKKNISLLCATIIMASGTLVAQAPKNWQHLNFDDNGIYGTESQRAYDELLKDKKNVKVIVAVIDSGTDIDHEDLKDVLWTNEKEIPNNGIDDDKNGYVDDIHGWNFLGGEDFDIYEETLEITRNYVRLSKQFEGKDIEKLSRKEKKQYKEYIKIKAEFEKEKKSTEDEYGNFNSILHQIERSYYLISAYLDKPDFNYNDLSRINSPDSIIMENVSGLAMALQGDTTINASLIIESMSHKRERIDSYFQEKLNYNLNPDWNPREDKDYDESDFKNFKYGNNHYLIEGEKNGHGTHCAGIIGASRNNEIGINGVANNVEIMTIRAVPNGDEHDKDIAAAMRYAIDNGARVISMSFGKAYSYNKGVVDDAVTYGRKKGVLFVHAAGNDGKNIDVENNFPNASNSSSNAKIWIEVGASSWQTGKNVAATFSNYGKKTVDLFAPGVEIYSTVPFNQYDSYSGTSMATPAVAGVAALIMSYYPKLSAKKVKSIMMKSVTDISDMDVIVPGSTEGEILKFEELCKSGGIVNAYKAIKLAEKYSK